LPIYSYSHQAILSSIPLPELPLSGEAGYDFVFDIETERIQVISFRKPYHWFSSPMKPVLSYFKQDSYHWLRFPDHADFRVSSNARHITCYPAPGTTLETIRHFLLDQVMPRCMAYHGEIILHASAVSIENCAIIFLGDSGTGKSTLAGNFHQSGQPIISDDCLLIKDDETGLKAVSTYNGLRLWDDSLEMLFPAGSKIDSMAQYSAKKRVLLDTKDPYISQNSFPVAAMFVLSPPENGPGEKIVLERLSSRDEFIAMMKQSFHLDVFDMMRIERYMQALGRIVPKLPAFQLTICHDYDLLPIARQKIFEAVSKLSASAKT
jgi:hypothetical protein